MNSCDLLFLIMTLGAAYVVYQAISPGSISVSPSTGRVSLRFDVSPSHVANGISWVWKKLGGHERKKKKAGLAQGPNDTCTNAAHAVHKCAEDDCDCDGHICDSADRGFKYLEHDCTCDEHRHIYVKADELVANDDASGADASEVKSE